MKIPFVQSATQREEEGLPAFRLQNLYPAMEGGQVQGLARQGPALVQMPGSETWITLGGAIRGLFQFPGAAGSDLYAVAGTAFQRVTTAGVATTLGTLTGTDAAMFDMIRDTVIVCANGAVHYTTGTTLTQITDIDLGTIRAIAAIDGRLLAARAGADTFVYSDVLSPGVIPTLNFATAEAYGDDLQRIIVYQRNVFLLGKRSTEIWAPTGDSDTPFARLGGAIEPVGLASMYSPALLGPELLFVATNTFDATPFVAMMSPEFQKVSDAGIDALLRSLSIDNLALVRGFAWRYAGASFYQISLPGLGSWVLHLESMTWLRRAYGTETAWHSDCYADAFGRHLVGSTTDGVIREMRADLSTDDNRPMRRIATAYLPAERPTPIDVLLVDGKGVNGAGPYTVDIEISRDDGRNWSAPRTVPIDGNRQRAPLTPAWGSIRRPGALARITIEGAYRPALYNLLVNEAAT